MNMKTAGIKAAVLSLLLGATASLCLAVDTRVWEQSDQSDFAQGTRKGLSIRSDGHVSLAPQFKELDSTSVPYLWTLAADSKGTIYYAGGAPTGATAKIFALAKNSKPRVLAELTGLEVHVLAVDRQDRVYAAVLPDAKIYRIDAAGKPQVFFDPKCKYIWAMAFDREGNLFVATGDNGLIYKVTPDGKGSKFYDTQETHARSMIIDEAGNLIVGTEPGGLILRISPAGKGFILYQANKREVTAVAEKNGTIYAAAIGGKANALAAAGAPPVLPANQTTVAPTGTPRPAVQPPAAAAAIGSFHASISGGSDLYAIQKDGFAERIWDSATDLVYALAFDAAGKPILGTGNKGTIYRVESNHLFTDVLTAPPTQVTSFLQGKDGAIYVTTGNVGNLYSLGPDFEKTGTLESNVLDAGDFSYWGKAHTASSLRGGSIAFETRSGNVNNPQNSWSPWSKVVLSETGGAVESPPARFLQYRLTLNRESGGGDSPDLSRVDIPFLSKNIAPQVEEVEVAPFNYRQPPTSNSLEHSVSTSGSPLTLALPAVGQKRSGAGSLSLESSGGATLQYSKGFVTLRWSAIDPNGDSLLFKVEIRAQNSTRWQLLKDKLQDRFFAFDSTMLPDGKYVARVTADDSPGNTPENTLNAHLESDPFTIDNTAPVISDMDVMKSGVNRTLKFKAVDALSWLDKAEYSIDGGDWVLIQPDNRVTDSQILNYTVSAKEGQALAVRVFDEDDNVVVKQMLLQ
ncbi:MAG TPA: hypothetical protein VHZ55_26665 [Bryobacteraceae bacterium]|nr:hypothetical protein [Bryobacteraceae bacterium]